MLNKLLEGLYHKIFVNIVVYRSKSIVYVEESNKDEIINSIEESFDTTTLNAKMYSFIKSHIEESPFHYISILDTSSSQGATPTCNPKEMPLYFDSTSSKQLCYADGWSYYSSKADLHLLKKEYSSIGVDFIFSPFVLLAKFFKDKIDKHTSMYVLIGDSFLSLAVFDHSELLFAEHLDMKNNKESDELLMDSSSMQNLEFELESSVNLDDIDVEDDIGELNDFGDIEDLDNFEDINEFSEIKEDEEKFIEEEDEYPRNETEGFNEEYQRFSLIKSSLKHFYKDDKYKSQFVESVYIADGVGVSSDLKRYLEEEIFLSVFVRRIDLCAEVCELAKAELQ